ncbi:serine/threonine-protein kinase ATM-like [Quercus robur]|uniref:serine/threonine-protein kinase ATM-like n=1 Tax=Quercus robur TaxID=38942 RepID=UPI002161780A|nr:serine/threonine-protein kinase ATM-like [Quercus robur]
MMCAVIAIDPCQRELVNAVLHNLSRQLKYASMLKLWSCMGIALNKAGLLRLLVTVGCSGQKSLCANLCYLYGIELQ